MIRALVIAGAVVWGVALVAYIVLMSTMSDEKYEQVTRNWPEGE